MNMGYGYKLRHKKEDCGREIYVNGNIFEKEYGMRRKL